MKKTLALILSALMLVSCFSVIASAATDDPVITDGTANATGTVIRPLSSGLHVVPAIGISDGTIWNSRYPEAIWTYEETTTEQLQLTNISNDYYPTIKVNQAEGDPVEVQVFGSRAKLAAPTRVTNLDILFETGAKNNKTYTNNAKIYASVDGETWDIIYTFSGVTATTTALSPAISNESTFYNYIALYTEATNRDCCRVVSIIVYGHTELGVLPVDVVKSYGQVSKGENDASLTNHVRDFLTQEAIWENASEVQYNADTTTNDGDDCNFDKPHTLKLTDGTHAQGYGAAAKLGTSSKVKYFQINRKNHATSKAWGANWGDITFYGSTDGGETWAIIGKGGAVPTSYATGHSFAVSDEYANTVFTDVAMLTTSKFRITQVFAFGTPAEEPTKGEVLGNMTTIDDGTKWVTKNDYVGYDRDPAHMWETTNTIFQWQSANVFALGDMGLGAAAKLEYPTKLTGFKLDFDMTNGKTTWKGRANKVSVYASVDGKEWVKLHQVSGVDYDDAENSVYNTWDESYVIHVDDDTLYNYVALYTSDAANGIRFKNVSAYGESNGEAMTLRGYQMKYYTDDGGVARAAVRFVATIDENSLDNQTLGFDIVADYVKGGVAGQQTFDVTTQYVYEKILANGKELTMDDIAAGSGHEYMVLGTVMDINRASYDYVTFKVTPYVVNAEGEKISSAPATVTPATGYPYADWTINGNSIAGYTIVYDADGVMQSTVEAFRDELKALSGYTLEIATSDASETDLEILIGETGRSATATVTRPLALNYTIATSGNKLVVRTGGEHSLELLMAEFFDVVKCGANEALTMGADYSVSGNYYDDPFNNTAMKSGADIRAMSANVLLRCEYKPNGDYIYDCQAYPELNTYENGTGTFEFDRRVEIFMAALDYYGADVIGVQEFCYHWVDAVNAYINATDNDNYDNWKIVVFDTWNTDRVEKDGNACSGIIYRTDKLTMTDSGMTPYTVRNNERGQCITWADFTVTATDETFTFVSTHWGAGTDEDTGSVIETLQAEELTAFVNAKKEAGATTVITTGDFNQGTTSNIYTGFLTATASVDALTSASKKINNTGSWHEWAGTTNSAGSIDHITATGGSVLTYETIFYNQQIYGSDHAWIVADLTIGG